MPFSTPSDPATAIKEVEGTLMIDNNNALSPGIQNFQDTRPVYPNLETAHRLTINLTNDLTLDLQDIDFDNRSKPKHVLIRFHHARKDSPIQL